MFGTMGVTELILILAIVLIVFGAGKLPKIGEGVGKALKGFKKEMREVEPPPQAPEQAQAVDAQVVSGGPQPVPPSGQTAPQPVTTTARTAPAAPPPVPPQMGPAATPGTTAYMAAQQAWKPVTPPPAAPPPPTAGSPTAAPGVVTQEPAFKAVVNKDAVNRVMKQQTTMKTKDAQAAEAAGISDPALVPNAASSQAKPAAAKGPSAQDFQSIGAGLGDAMRTFREAANDVRRAVDPEMQTIKAEMEAAQKEIQSSIDQVKHGPKPDEPPSKSS